MSVLAGTISNNAVAVENDLSRYNGCRVVITILDTPRKKRDASLLVNDDFVIPSDRANHVDDYMKEMRDNDRV